MLFFIPAWYQKNNWCENEQYWYVSRSRTEFDDTVKHIQLFHRSGAYPFQIMLLSFAPNFRHFLHRQGVFHAPYWSCFDAIQEVRRKKVKMFSFHNLNWPENVEFIYTPFCIIAQRNGEKYAQVEFAEDGNLIQVDIYKNGEIQRRNIYDDRGFVSSSIVYENKKPLYQDYLTDKGVWKIRHYTIDGYVEVNPKSPTYLLEYKGKEYIREFSSKNYDSLSQVIQEVLKSYIELLDEKDLFCVAMHELHTEVLKDVLREKKMILSFFESRYNKMNYRKDLQMIESADYIIADTLDNLNSIKNDLGKPALNIVDITPFDSRVDFGISAQLSVQKILVPVDGLENAKFENLIRILGEYLPKNESARVHLFTRVSEYGQKKALLEYTRRILAEAGLNADWAREDINQKRENPLDSFEETPIRFFVEQCVDELSVSKCIREQRIIVDMRNITELYLRIAGISVGIPQILYKETQFLEDGKNGVILKYMNRLPELLDYYLNSLTNWNEAKVHAYEIGKRYTTKVLMNKWKEVIEFVEHDSSATD